MKIRVWGFLFICIYAVAITPVLAQKSQQKAIDRYVQQYYAILNNLGDASLSVEDKKLFVFELNKSYVDPRKTMMYNDLLKDGSRVLPAAEYANHIITLYSRGITFSVKNIRILNLDLGADGVRIEIIMDYSVQASGKPANRYTQYMMIEAQRLEPDQLIGWIKTVDRHEGGGSDSVSGGDGRKKEPGQADDGDSNPEVQLWRSAVQRDQRLYYEKYLEQYPAGRYAEEARDRIRALLPMVLREMEDNMVEVVGGGFYMGCMEEQGGDCDDDESLVHWVELSDFKISRYEVTQGLWEHVMGNTVRDQRDKRDPSLSLSGVGSDYPMYYVSWEDVGVFIDKLNAMTGGSYRLPTEAEWEYAARGGNKSKGYKYSGSDDLKEVGWYDENSDGGTHPIGRIGKSNELGLYDMSGNVWEWCSDRYGEYESVSQKNPQGPSDGRSRVGRGGGWGSNARYCRVSNRRNHSPDDRNSSLGFRLASQ